MIQFNKGGSLSLVLESHFRPFVARRSNFEGVKLIAMTMNHLPYVKIDEKVRLASRFYPENDTFDVTGQPASGSFLRIANTLESILNFSTTRYMFRLCPLSKFEK